MKKHCIDLHAHPVPDSFRKAMEELEIGPIEEDGFPLPKWSAEEHLAFMKEAGIDHSVLSAPVEQSTMAAMKRPEKPPGRSTKISPRS